MSPQNDKIGTDGKQANQPLPSTPYAGLQLKDMPGFGPVPSARGAATYRHPGEGRLFGLSYDVQPEGNDAWYRLRIEAWTFGVQDDSLSLPVMDFLFKPDGGGGPAQCRVNDLKIMSRPLPADMHTGARALSVALFFINQINAGQVPNCEKILKLHGLYPVAKGHAQDSGQQAMGHKGDH